MDEQEEIKNVKQGIRDFYLGNSNLTFEEQEIRLALLRGSELRTKEILEIIEKNIWNTPNDGNAILKQVKELFVKSTLKAQEKFMERDYKSLHNGTCECGECLQDTLGVKSNE